MKALTDERLCALAQDGDRRAADELMGRYERMAAGKATDFFLPGHDRDDVRQEARVGLHKAIRLFRGERGVPFRLYAMMSVQQQLITALKTARRFKHRVLDEAVRVGTSEHGEAIDISDLLRSPLSRDPHLICVEKEHLASLISRMKTLTPIERRCEWCGSCGQQYGKRLRELGLVKQHRRKAAGGDSVLVWTVAGRLVRPVADRGFIPF